MYRILMIDDEPWLMLARKSFLEEKGCRVETAGHGRCCGPPDA